tara:strand:- start:49 stop:504 length:456 start_codon:yes stop_codon:yes gene_type:complete
MFVGLFLTVTLIPLQSCSNTLIGEKLENSFDIIENPTISENTNNVKTQNKPNEIKKIKLSKQDNENVQVPQTKNYQISNKDRLSQKTTKSKKKVIFNPQPYRIILKLSAADPSAPAETVTATLRKAGVEFEVEKIERFDEKSLLKDSSLKR